MKLVDCSYLNSFGGETIVKLFLNSLPANQLNTFFFLFDKRLNKDLYREIPTTLYITINSSHINRYFFYKKRKSEFQLILCLANIPPPIRIQQKTIIYFHNALLLNLFKNELSFKSRFIFYLKKSYLKFFNSSSYIWVVQTALMEKSLKDIFNNNPIYKYPIFQSVYYSSLKDKNIFFYPSSLLTHKNHSRLLAGFLMAAKCTNKEIKLHLTIKKEKLFLNEFPKNLKVEYHGTLSENRVNELYNSCEFVIYPSLIESFGLPLIEASNYSCKVIASNLPYVHEIVKPSLTFDPYSVESISNSILIALETDDLPQTRVLVENKLDNFIEFIISQDVQR